MDNKIITGIVGLVTLLIGFGGALYLSPDQVNHGYVCAATQKLGLFDNLSLSNKTGYYTVNQTLKSSSCTGGWIKLTTYAKQQNINIDDSLPINSCTQYLCNQVNCTCIK